MSDLKTIIKLAAQVVLFRNGDVTTEDGDFATTDCGSIIHLEESLAHYFNLDSDDITSKNINNLIRKIDEMSNIEQLQQRIAELESQVPKWVSVEDELPKKDGDYICYRPCKPNQFAIRSFKKDRRLDNNGFSGVYDVSHWMLPLPPKENTNERD